MLRIRYRNARECAQRFRAWQIIYGSALTESFRNGEATLCWPFPDDYNPPKTKEAANWWLPFI
jgi:hypothetical protein